MEQDLKDIKELLYGTNINIEIKLLPGRIIDDIDEDGVKVGLVGKGPCFFADLTFLSNGKLLAQQLESDEICTYIESNLECRIAPVDTREELVGFLIEICKAIKATE